MKAVMNRVQSRNLVAVSSADFPVEADYDIRTSIAGRKPDMFRPLQLVVQLDGKDYKTFTIGVGNRNGRGFDQRVHVPDGDHVLTARLLLLPFDEKAQDAYAKLKETTQKLLVEGTAASEKKQAALVDFSRDPATDDPQRAWNEDRLFRDSRTLR